MIRPASVVPPHPPLLVLFAIHTHTHTHTHTTAHVRRICAVIEQDHDHGNDDGQLAMIAPHEERQIAEPGYSSRSLFSCVSRTAAGRAAISASTGTVADAARCLDGRSNDDHGRMKLRGEVDLQTYRAVTRELDAAHDQLAREHEKLTSEAAMPELPDPSLAWEDLSASDRRALTEMLVDKIIIAPHPHKIDKDGRRQYTIRAIPYQDPQQEAERLKAVHEARVKIVPRV